MRGISQTERYSGVRTAALSCHEYGPQEARAWHGSPCILTAQCHCREMVGERIRKFGTYLAFCQVQSPAQGSRCHEAAALWANQPSAPHTLFIKRRNIDIQLPIRPINFPFPEFQAACRVKHLTLVVVVYPLVTLTGMSADAEFPRQRYS
jgi:hypothetical protein